MNIDKIVKECPRAWAEFVNYKYPRFGVDYNGIFKVSMRNDYIYITTKTHQDIYIYTSELFDYFDSISIYITMVFRHTLKMWDYVLYYTDYQQYSSESMKSRYDAKSKAFERAFEIREKQIEQNNQEN